MIKNALLIFGVCAAIFVFFLPSYLSMQALNEKNNSYARQIRDLIDKNEALTEEKRRLLEDPAYFEKVAREKMGLLKEGELIYKIVTPEEKKVSDARAAALKELEEKAADKIKPSPTPVPKKKTTAPKSKKGVKKGSKKVLKTQ
jgi:cell division protein FtsB